MQRLAMKKFALVLCGVFFFSCQYTADKTAQELIDASITYYGQNRWDQIDIHFQFRKHRYSLHRADKQTVYTRETLHSPFLLDSLYGNGKFVRYKQDIPQQLSDSLQQVYAASVNSVLYFFQIPHVLNDPAVIKKRLPDTWIKNKKYHQVQITFQQEGGGADYEDEFRYWLDPETYAVDYLAYKYLTDGGGVRFRAVKNRRSKSGFVFQDYRNYKPKNSTQNLDSLPGLFNRAALLEISQIENTNLRIKSLQ